MNRRSSWASGAIVAAVALLLTMLAITPAAAGPRKIGFSSSTYSVTEGDGTATIAITRTTTRGAASVIFYTGPSSSATTADFSPVTATTVSFAAGESSATVPITIKVDKVTGEGDETVPLVLSTPSKGYKLGTSSATLIIHEMPLPPTPTLAAPVVNGPTSISLSWSIPADSPVGYRWIFAVYKSTDGEEYSELTRGDGLSELEVTGLTPSTQYWFMVRGLNEDGAWGAFSGSKTATTTPPAPTWNSWYANPAPQFQWNLGAGYGSQSDIISYEVERSIDAPGTENRGWVNQTSGQADPWWYAEKWWGSFTDPAISINVTYYYRVRAANGGVVGPWSEELVLTPTGAD